MGDSEALVEIHYSMKRFNRCEGLAQIRRGGHLVHPLIRWGIWSTLSSCVEFKKSIESIVYLLVTTGCTRLYRNINGFSGQRRSFLPIISRQVFWKPPGLPRHLLLSISFFTKEVGIKFQ